NMGSPSQSPSGLSNSSGTSSGRYDVFHLADFSTDVNNSNRDMSHYSTNNNKGGGSGSEWNANESSIKRETINMDIDQKEEARSLFYLGGQPMERNGSRNVTEQQLKHQYVKREDEESNSSMKIRDLLN
ncbi:17049_t:CDS:1, partial [Racocetra persica]